MEEENPQKSVIESKLFEIPVDEYEEDMDTESAKGKKTEILDILNNYNKLRSVEEFKEIKYDLHISCRKGELDLIKIYLSETIQNDSNTLQFKIDKTNRTASLFKVKDDIKEVIIPRTVEHESVEYLITSIIGLGYDLKTLKFAEDSAIKTFYGNIFSFFSKIEEMYFPSSLNELNERWCCNTINLAKIVISPMNGQFKMKDDKYLIGKSDSNKDEFDILLFVRRDTKKISIPSNIRIISPYSFQNCKNLTKVEIPTNSNLQIIEKYAFSNSTIDEIYLPTSLNELKEGLFCNTDNLTKIVISPMNGQFKMKEDKYLIGKSDSNKEEFDILLFACRDIKEISIPSNIKIISPYSFQNCKNLTKVEIPTNSNLQTIEKYAFHKSAIKNIFIPSTVSKIGEGAFCFCQNLTKVEIPTNSNLQKIDEFAFFGSNIKDIFIPSTVSKICKNAFKRCENLIKVEIPANSNLQTIEEFAFMGSNIKDIFIPNKVSKICKGAFSYLNNIQIIEISEESKMESFPYSAFNENPEFIIMIPSQLEKMIRINKLI